MTKAEWKPLQLRLQGLRTLAARTEFVEEARNAGLAFIRLVIKHNLVVLDPDLMEKEFAQVVARNHVGHTSQSSTRTRARASNARVPSPGGGGRKRRGKRGKAGKR